MLFDHRYLPSSSMDVTMKNSLYHHQTPLIANHTGLSSDQQHPFSGYPYLGQTSDSLHFLLNTPINPFVCSSNMSSFNHHAPSYDDFSYQKPLEHQALAKGKHNPTMNGLQPVKPTCKSNSCTQHHHAGSSPSHLSEPTTKASVNAPPQRKQSNVTPTTQHKHFSSSTSTSKRSLEAFANSTDFNDIVVQQSTNQQQTNDNQASYNGKDRYKTELCRSWEETGFCRYGDKCQFAHGRQELRVVTRHHKAVIGRALSQNIDMVPIQQASRLPVFKEQIDTVPTYFFTTDSVNQ
ncbi:hypothetical protein C9374_007383 [Naegleria lovaniensis]|uniref:C3H1-type domain-containing protein n=1 Tax=Naegleria lovaniensis TaxID=51637 RepID=A0AA88KLS8_NAELO|nr:uncharacterized protein C9374_007383 [Naegleria lovaniensis]KAG2379244.1 hypothetical protein C9374_007383 [Naegleria lovaniensis]